MKIAVISDIHGNLEALQAALMQIDVMEINSVYCLGDIVGYGANPNECIDLIQARNILSVVGNHDKAAIGEIPVEKFSEAARLAIEWTQSILSPFHREFLSGLPYCRQDHHAMFVHASPDSPEKFRYLFDQEDTSESFPSFSEPICFVGHTHRPEIFCEDGTTQIISPNDKFIINVGSVGQPRDGNWRPCFVTYDTEKFTIEFIRIEYNAEVPRQKILSAGLPKKLADRLLIGI